MLLKELYQKVRCDIWKVAIGKSVYEYGVFSKKAENQPYITDIFSYEVLEILIPAEQTIFVKIRRKR